MKRKKKFWSCSFCSDFEHFSSGTFKFGSVFLYFLSYPGHLLSPQWTVWCGATMEWNLTNPWDNTCNFSISLFLHLHLSLSLFLSLTRIRFCHSPSPPSSSSSPFCLSLALDLPLFFFQEVREREKERKKETLQLQTAKLVLCSLQLFLPPSSHSFPSFLPVAPWSLPSSWCHCFSFPTREGSFPLLPFLFAASLLVTTVAAGAGAGPPTITDREQAEKEQQQLQGEHHHQQ